MTSEPHDLAVIIEAAEMIGRAGARSFEVGHHPAFDGDGDELDEATTPASEFRWWAKATWKGAMLAVDDHPDPVSASLALALRVQADARYERPIRGTKRHRHHWWNRYQGD